MSELAAWRAAGRDAFVLDVRRHDEIDIAPMPDAVHVPMHEIPARFSEIPNDAPIVVVCHYGERSRHVAHFLVAQGFDDVFNLEGGIDAWALSVDPSVPRY